MATRWKRVPVFAIWRFRLATPRRGHRDSHQSSASIILSVTLLPVAIHYTHLAKRLGSIGAPSVAAKRLRRLAEGADEGAAHALRIAKAGMSSHPLDRF